MRVPAGERVITIEDAAELRLALPHVVRLESRPAGIEGRGAVPIRALVRNALRMRPDRIIVGEVRGGEALDLIQALTTGHEGSLSTLHASSPQDALRRLVTLALMGDVDLPYRAVADQVASAVDLIVHQARAADGRRRVAEVAAVDPGADGPTARPLVRWRATGRRRRRPHRPLRADRAGARVAAGGGARRGAGGSGVSAALGPALAGAAAGALVLAVRSLALAPRAGRVRGGPGPLARRPAGRRLGARLSRAGIPLGPDAFAGLVGAAALAAAGLAWGLLRLPILAPVAAAAVIVAARASWAPPTRAT